MKEKVCEKKKMKATERRNSRSICLWTQGNSATGQLIKLELTNYFATMQDERNAVEETSSYIFFSLLSKMCTSYV